MVTKIRAQGSGLRAQVARRALSPQPSALLVALVLCASTASAQAVGGADKARAVAGDPGISSMVVMEQHRSPDVVVVAEGLHVGGHLGALRTIDEHRHGHGDHRRGVWQGAEALSGPGFAASAWLR